ncbi:MAG: hypothetical protein CVT77_08100 [Alphaproteobacteria bacterium HGW-Alphaproteobacteria-16]|nr:MAG: hypothetical protein CVT77_08100 [Alphaproteobacteria bacterium HGW-Alphaproteobacteria-16]
MRKLLGVVVGVVVLGITIWIVERIGHGIWPPPAGTDLSDPQALGGLMDTIPLGAKVAVVTGWFLGAVTGGWTARWIARWNTAAWIVTAIGAALGIITLLMIPHPLWMQLSAVLAPALGAWIATRLPLPRA